MAATDRIYVRDLDVECIIGTMPKERVARQLVRINLVLECDLALSGASDRIEDTLNYRTLKDELVGFVGSSEFYLIERLATEVARICLSHERVLSVTVTVDKPGALTSARSVGVEIHRRREA